MNSESPTQNNAQNSNNNGGASNPVINKDNIFDPNILNTLLQPGSQPQPTQQNDSNNQPNVNVNEQQTEKLTNMLSGLGFSIGGNEVAQPQPPQTLEIVARSLDGIYLVDVDEKDYLGNEDKMICAGGHVSVFSVDGKLLGYANNTSIGVYNFETKQKQETELPGVVNMHFSRTSKYIVACFKREKENKDNQYYIVIYETKTLNKIFEYDTMKYKKEQWPHVKFVDDDTIAFRTRKPGVIEEMNPLKKFKVVRSIQTGNFDYFSISVKLQNLLIVTVLLEHTAGYDKNEGKVEVYQYRNLKQPVMSEVIEQAHEINLCFSPTGQNLLIWTQSFTDRSNQSYYGEHRLFYLNMKTYKLKRVPTYKGPIHDICWNPNGKDFIVLSGFMPAGSVLFDKFCVPKYEFGRHHRNTIRWSPNSRFVCLAGYGNLSGDMEFWDVENFKQLGTAKSNSAVSCEWAPNGRRLMTGVLHPRLRVDNDYKVFKYDGTLMNTVSYNKSELYQVLWRPGEFEDIPQSPEKKPEKPKESTTTAEGEKPKEGESAAPKRMFRANFGGSFAAQFKKDKQGTTGGRFLDPTETFGNDDEEAKEENTKVQQEMNKHNESRPKFNRAAGNNPQQQDTKTDNNSPSVNEQEQKQAQEKDKDGNNNNNNNNQNGNQPHHQKNHHKKHNNKKNHQNSGQQDQQKNNDTNKNPTTSSNAETQPEQHYDIFGKPQSEDVWKFLSDLGQENNNQQQTQGNNKSNNNPEQGKQLQYDFNFLLNQQGNQQQGKNKQQNNNQGGLQHNDPQFQQFFQLNQDQQQSNYNNNNQQQNYQNNKQQQFQQPQGYFAKQNNNNNQHGQKKNYNNNKNYHQNKGYNNNYNQGYNQQNHGGHNQQNYQHNYNNQYQQQQHYNQYQDQQQSNNEQPQIQGPPGLGGKGKGGRYQQRG